MDMALVHKILPCGFDPAAATPRFPDPTAPDSTLRGHILAVLCVPTLTASEKALLVALVTVSTDPDRSGAFASYRELGGLTGRRYAAVLRAMKSLEARGVVRRHLRRGKRSLTSVDLAALSPAVDRRLLFKWSGPAALDGAQEPPDRQPNRVHDGIDAHVPDL